MDIIRADSRTNTIRAIKKALEVSSHGGVVLYPTDTVYGLGADALSDVAVAKVYKTKRRDLNKPMHAIFSDFAMASVYAHITDDTHALSAHFLPGPLSLVLKKKRGVKTGIAHSQQTLGVRIPNKRFCLEMSRAFGAPSVFAFASGSFIWRASLG